MMNPLVVTSTIKPGRACGMALRWLRLAAFVTAALVVGPVTSAHAAASANNPAAVSPQETKAILMRMADFLAKAKSFSVELRNSYDVYESTGQKIEFNQVRKIIIVRPDHLRVEVEDSSGDKNLVIYDGKELSVSSPAKNVYAQTSKPGTIDDAVVYFVRDLGMRLPLAALLLTTAPSDIERRTQRLDYVEKTTIFGTPAHHLAGRTDSVDYQIWIADGDKPLPLRVVLTYREEKGQPQFRAQFSDWNLSPQAPASMFEFTPPTGANKISFLAQLPRKGQSAAKSSKPRKSGGLK